MPSIHTASFPLNPLAILFTNAAGRVVFANRNFVRLAKQPASRIVAGERFEAFLPVDAQSASSVIHIIGQTGYLDPLPVSIRTTTGSLIPAICSGIAAHDEKGAFIGADIVLNAQSATASPRPGASAPKHTDVLRAYVSEVFSEGGDRPAKTFMQAYVVAQVDMLQVLLARMGGSGMRNALERVLNEAAIKNDIQADMRDGYLEFAQKPMHFGVYRTLLLGAVGYAVSAIGQRIVKQEMETVDRYVDPGLLELLTQMNLRTTFADD